MLTQEDINLIWSAPLGTYTIGTAGWYLARIGSNTITITSPLTTEGNLTLIKGDSYKNSDNRAILYTDTENIWPVLTSGTVRMVCEEFVKTGTILSATDTKQIYFEFNPEDTQNIGRNEIDYKIKVTLPTGSVITLIRGNLTLE